MSKTFVRPLFDGRDVEVRYEDGEVAIYATPEGLRALAGHCSQLADKLSLQNTESHVHLEDYALLTSNSCRATIGAFRR